MCVRNTRYYTLLNIIMKIKSLVLDQIYYLQKSFNFLFIPFIFSLKSIAKFVYNLFLYFIIFYRYNKTYLILIKIKRFENICAHDMYCNAN